MHGQVVELREQERVVLDQIQKIGLREEKRDRRVDGDDIRRRGPSEHQGDLADRVARGQRGDDQRLVTILPDHRDFARGDQVQALRGFALDDEVFPFFVGARDEAFHQRLALLWIDAREDSARPAQVLHHALAGVRRELDPHLGLLRSDPIEVLLARHEHDARLARDDAGRAGCTGQKRHLAEQSAVVEAGEDDRLSLVLLPHHLELAARDDVRFGPLLPLHDDALAFRHRLHLEDLHHPTEAFTADAREKRLRAHHRDDVVLGFLPGFARVADDRRRLVQQRHPGEHAREGMEVVGRAQRGRGRAAVAQAGRALREGVGDVVKILV
jgi:hypothetical protein